MKTLHVYKRSLRYCVIILIIAVALIGCKADVEADLGVEKDAGANDSVSENLAGITEYEILTTEQVTLSKEELRSIKDHLIQASGIDTFRYSMDAIIKTNVAGIDVKVPISISGEFEPVDKAKSVVSINM